RKLPLLGMPQQSDWALVGPFYDRSMIRHAFIYDLGRELGLQAPRFSFAEVYLNHDGGALETTDYEGIYMVVETIKNAKERLDLQQLDELDTDEADVAGGYIFKFDWAAASEPTIACTEAPALAHSYGTCPTEGADRVPASTATCEGEDGMPAGFGGGTGGGFGGAAPPPGGGGFAGGMVDPEEEVVPATCWADLEVTDPVPLNDAQRGWLTNYITQFNDTL